MRAEREEVPDPGARTWSRISIEVRTRASVEPGGRLSVLAEAGEYTAELEILLVRHRSSERPAAPASPSDACASTCHTGCWRPRPTASATASTRS